MHTTLTGEDWGSLRLETGVEAVQCLAGFIRKYRFHGDFHMSFIPNKFETSRSFWPGNGE